MDSRVANEEYRTPGKRETVMAKGEKSILLMTQGEY
jgi:hypothetical protein